MYKLDWTNRVWDGTRLLSQVNLARSEFLMNRRHVEVCEKAADQTLGCSRFSALSLITDVSSGSVYISWKLLWFSDWFSPHLSTGRKHLHPSSLHHHGKMLLFLLHSNLVINYSSDKKTREVLVKMNTKYRTYSRFKWVFYIQSKIPEFINMVCETNNWDIKNIIFICIIVCVLCSSVCFILPSNKQVRVCNY